MRKFTYAVVFVFIYHHSFSQNYFTGLVGDFTLSPNQNSINIGAKTINIWGGEESSHYTMQLNLYYYDWILQDRYNNDSTTGSVISCYNWVWMFVTGISALIYTHDSEKPSWTMYVVLGPSVLINSQHGYVFLNRSIGSKYFFSSSAFFKTKLDYFEVGKFQGEPRDVCWWRYKPGLGIEAALVGNAYQDNPLGLAFTAGFDKPFDYVNKEWKTNDWLPTFGVKLLLM